MIGSLLPIYQASMADYGACVIPCLLLVGYGKAEIRCYDYPPRSKGTGPRLAYGLFTERTLCLASAPAIG